MEATRSALIAAAHRLFAEKGFHATGTMEIVKAACVTRGALQHYFPRKEDLFREVFEQTSRAMVNATAKRIAAEGWGGLIADLKDFLSSVATLEVQRIAFIDGPAVLGWAEWRRLQSDYSLRTMEMAIRDGIDKGLIGPQPPRALAHLILSMIEQATLMALNAQDLHVTPKDIEVAMVSLLSSLNPQRR